MSNYDIWVGHVKSVNLTRVITEEMNRGKTDLIVSQDDVNFFHTLGKDQDTAVECLKIIDISQRTNFHFMVRSKENFA